MPTGAYTISYASDPASFTVPSGINVLKVENSYYTEFVGVTEGKTYTLTREKTISMGNAESGVVWINFAPTFQSLWGDVYIYWSYEINNTTPTIEDY